MNLNEWGAEVRRVAQFLELDPSDTEFLVSWTIYMVHDNLEGAKTFFHKCEVCGKTIRDAGDHLCERCYNRRYENGQTTS